MRRKEIFTSVIVICIMSFILAGCVKNDAETARNIKVIDLGGTSNYMRNDKESDVYISMNFEPADEVTTMEDSFLTMELDSDRYVHMFDDTTVVMEYSGDENNNLTHINLVSGEIYCDINSSLSEESEFQIKTSNATIAIVGTEFYTKYDADKTILYCQEGKVEIQAPNNTIEIEAGKAVLVEDDTATEVDIAEVESEISITIPVGLENTASPTGIPAEDVVDGTAESGTAKAGTIDSSTLLDSCKGGIFTYKVFMQGDGMLEMNETTEVDGTLHTVYTGTVDGKELIVTVISKNGFGQSIERKVDGEVQYTGTYTYHADKFSFYNLSDGEGNLCVHISALDLTEDGKPLNCSLSNFEDSTEQEILCEY